jgi:ferredoxin
MTRHTEESVKLIVDADKCQGHARCAALAPDVFELDDLGNVATRSGIVPPDLEAQARLGAAACPERALTVE